MNSVTTGAGITIVVSANHFDEYTMKHGELPPGMAMSRSTGRLPGETLLSAALKRLRRLFRCR